MNYPVPKETVVDVHVLFNDREHVVEVWGRTWSADLFSHCAYLLSCALIRWWDPGERLYVGQRYSDGANHSQGHQDFLGTSSRIEEAKGTKKGAILYLVPESQSTVP